MFFTRENETLYPTTREYNIALILGELKTVIENNGGRVKPHTRGQIINRSFYRAAEEETKRADMIRNYISIKAEKGQPIPAENLEKRNEAIKAHEEAAADYTRKAEASRRDAENITYMQFVYQGFYYYLQISEFNDHLTYSKTPIKGDKYSRDTYSEKVSNQWDTDAFYTLEPGAEIDADRREAANLIFNEITSAPASEIYRESHRVRVANTYNNRYHYETIYNPERTAKIDF